MSRRPRRSHTPAFKAKVALAAIKGDRTIAHIAEQFDVHPNQVTSWKAQLEGGAADMAAWARLTTLYRCRLCAGLFPRDGSYNPHAFHPLPRFCARVGTGRSRWWRSSDDRPFVSLCVHRI